MNGFRISRCLARGVRFHSKSPATRRAKRTGTGLLALMLLGSLTACRHTPSYSGPPSLVIHVLMKKWMIVPNRIVVPEGAKVELIVTTADVEHGIAVPGLAINEPVQPGWTTVVRFLAQKSGVFPMHCSIACGRGHDKMTGVIVIAPPPSAVVTPARK